MNVFLTMLKAEGDRGIENLKSHWRQDLLAGFLVFLIALPLCLGIAMASGFPPAAGVITAIVGGLLVSRFSGSQLTINGPAAGLIAVILGATQTLGDGDAILGIKRTLAALTVAAVIQMGLGFFKAGRLNSFVPHSVVHGMLAAIGFIIMVKQIPVLLGGKALGTGIFSVLLEIPRIVTEANLEIAFIGFVSLGVLIYFHKTENKTARKIPGPIVVIALGMMFSHLFDLGHEHIYLLPKDFNYFSHHEFTIGPKFLVTIPSNLKESFYGPDFSLIGQMRFWLATMTIALVGSLETMISALAIDKLDPKKRRSNLDRDLIAVGFGNLICSFLGGLPMIAEIVRSSSNINNGAKSGWSNFFHGAFLLVFIIFFPHILHAIPLSALAGILIFTGFRLASPKIFAKTLEIGTEQLIIFFITMVGCVAIDLLAGVALGILTKFIVHSFWGVKPSNLFQLDHSMDFCEEENTLAIRLEGPLVFSNLLKLKKRMEGIPKDQDIEIHFTQTAVVDHTAMDYLNSLKEEYTQRGGRCQFIDIERHVSVSEHPLAARRIHRDRLTIVSE